MRFKLSVCVVVVAFDRCFLDRPVHPLHLSIRPGVVHLRPALIDVMLTANAAEDVLHAIFILFAIGELDAVIR